MRSLPDGMTGAIMAVEGISDARAFLHGPGGCRARHMVHSTAVFPRPDSDQSFSEPYFYGYDRVPATYLDEYDYINGALYKVEEALPYIVAKEPSLIVTLDSPGAGLIGDDHDAAFRSAGIDRISIHIGENLSSMPMTEGAGRTLAAVMGHLSPERGDVRRGKVNLLGLSIMDKDWRAAREDLSVLLGDMGLEVACAPGAGSSVGEMMRSVDSEVNVVVCPEMCVGLRGWYASEGVPEAVSPMGAPVGFDATEAWVRTVADATGRDPTRALERIDRCRVRITEKFEGMRYNALRIRGMTFSVAGTASVVRPLAEWLYGYLAMAPGAAKADPGADPIQAEALRRFLDSAGFGEAWDREPEAGSGAVLCEGIAAETMRLRGECRVAIPIGYSTMGLDDVIPRPVYGMQGAMYILDELLHGVRGL